MLLIRTRISIWRHLRARVKFDRIGKYVLEATTNRPFIQLLSRLDASDVNMHHRLSPSSRTSPPIRLKRKHSCNTRHENIQRRADVYGHRSPSLSRLVSQRCHHDLPQIPFKRSKVETYISNRSNNRTQYTHDPIPPNRNPVPRPPMRTRQYLGRIRIQRAVVDVQAKVDDACECHILPFSSACFSS
jgi:hypothetical protein